MFSGPCAEETHLASALAARGFQAEPVDILIGGTEHDLARADISASYIRRIRAGHYSVVALGTPCSTYSVLRDPPLRSKADPSGETIAPPDKLTSIRLHNTLAEVTADAILAAHDARTPWICLLYTSDAADE